MPERPIPNPADPLKNERHEIFCNHVAAGMSYMESYQKTYNVEKNAAAMANGLKQKPEIVARIDFLKRQNAERSGWTREESMSRLKRIIDNPDVAVSNQLKAIEILNEMCGFKQPAQQNLNIENNGVMFLAKDGDVTLGKGLLEDMKKAVQKNLISDNLKPKPITVPAKVVEEKPK